MAGWTDEGACFSPGIEPVLFTWRAACFTGTAGGFAFTSAFILFVTVLVQLCSWFVTATSPLWGCPGRAASFQRHEKYQHWCWWGGWKAAAWADILGTRPDGPAVCCSPPALAFLSMFGSFPQLGEMVHPCSAGWDTAARCRSRKKGDGLGSLLDLPMEEPVCRFMKY